jgi:hypothetical protein
VQGFTPVPDEKYVGTYEPAAELVHCHGEVLVVTLLRGPVFRQTGEPLGHATVSLT